MKDKTTLLRDVRRQIAPAIDRLRQLVSDIIGYLPLIAFAIVIFLAFWFLAFLLGKWDGLWRRFTTNEFLADFVRQLTKLAVLALGLVVAFELLDATALVGTVLGAAGLLGLALGFALRDTVENYIAGILLSMKQPFVHNDWVAIENHEGHVLRLTSRATIVMTLDGNHVRIPNAKVFNGIVVNYTRNPERRFYFDVGVSVDSNLCAAQDLAAKTLVEMEGVIEDPPPRADVHALGDFNVTLRVYGWVDQRHFAFLKVKSEATRLVKEAFDAAGIVMPEPIYNLRMQQQGTAGQEPKTRPSAGPKVPSTFGAEAKSSGRSPKTGALRVKPTCCVPTRPWSKPLRPYSKRFGPLLGGGSPMGLSLFGVGSPLPGSSGGSSTGGRLRLRGGGFIGGFLGSLGGSRRGSSRFLPICNLVSSFR